MVAPLAPVRANASRLADARRGPTSGQMDFDRRHAGDPRRERCVGRDFRPAIGGSSCYGHVWHLSHPAVAIAQGTEAERADDFADWFRRSNLNSWRTTARPRRSAAHAATTSQWPAQTTATFMRRCITGVLNLEIGDRSEWLPPRFATRSEPIVVRARQSRMQILCWTRWPA